MNGDEKKTRTGSAATVDHPDARTMRRPRPRSTRQKTVKAAPDEDGNQLFRRTVADDRRRQKRDDGAYQTTLDEPKTVVEKPMRLGEAVGETHRPENRDDERPQQDDGDADLFDSGRNYNRPVKDPPGGGTAIPSPGVLVSSCC